ncbi:hypothetical protein NP233_g8101 [Leucocoprinus birnbaumii]|uniref:Uncharacterized protein n=1 Tax=Leucocoprinus birnbaumii TaxID=56174 RepID=A0AAD5VPJ5_9AGAR|nr:hypothetical protein NP233_g8101 [Leucocoprinus birnbaumii]
MAAPPLVAIAPPWVLLHQPVGTWGISFDLDTRKISRDLPHGWGAHPSTIYHRTKAYLPSFGFIHAQGSVYQRPATTAFATWNVMFGLRHIRPYGIFPSVVKKLQMFSIVTPAMIVTDVIRLGGVASPVALGPTPIGLFPPGMLVHPMPAPPIPLPSGTRPTPNAQTGLNWST